MKAARARLAMEESYFIRWIENYLAEHSKTKSKTPNVIFNSTGQVMVISGSLAPEVINT